MVNPWVLLAVGVLWALSLAGVGKWQRADGRSAERVEWQAERIKLQAEWADKLTKAEDGARAQERAHVDAMAAIGANYAKGLHDAEKIRARDVAAARDGALVLRLPSSICGSGPGGAGPAGASAGRIDDPEGVKLPRAIAADLLSLAGDADQVADQLRACQAIVLSDRKEPP